MITATAITKKYKNDVTAVDDVTMSLENGKLYGIKGNSGSGKTTLLQLLSTLDSPTSGEIIIDGEPVNKLKPAEISQLRSQKIGFIFQAFHLHPNLTALQNVMLPMFINSKQSDKELASKATELLTMVGLEKRLKHYPKQLSGGEQQRVAIARAIANNPEYIFADEPSGNLDSTNEKMVFDILKKLAANGKCVIVVSHNEIIDEYSDVLFKMSDGKFILQEEKA